MQRTFLDSAIGWLSPERGLARLQARARTQALHNAQMLYDGATRGRRLGGRIITGTDGNAEVQAAGTTLREVAREMVRNIPGAARGVQAARDRLARLGVEAAERQMLLD